MMIPSELLTVIGRRHFIAEVRTGTAKQALGAVEALARGGMSVFEISNAIPGATEILRHFVNSSDIIVGMGGVLDTRQVEEAVSAGARFVVSPITAPELVRFSAEHHITCILGALTPTEIITAQRAGAELVKVFPISAMGGSTYLRSLYRQFTHLSLMVAGGITMENLVDYLSLPVRAVTLGSTLIPRSLVERDDWGAITSIARRYVEFAQQWDAAGGVAAIAAQQRPISGSSSRPMVPDTMMSPSAMPVQPSRSTPPAASQPRHPQPSNPIEMPAITPQPPQSSPSFKPWDSKPIGPDDDWIN